MVTKVMVTKVMVTMVMVTIKWWCKILLHCALTLHRSNWKNDTGGNSHLATHANNEVRIWLRSHDLLRWWWLCEKVHMGKIHLMCRLWQEIFQWLSKFWNIGGGTGRAGEAMAWPLFGLLLESKIESAVGYDMITPTTNVRNRDCLHLVTRVRFAHGWDAHLLELSARCDGFLLSAATYSVLFRLVTMSPLPRLHHHDIMTIVELFFSFPGGSPCHHCLDYIIFTSFTTSALCQESKLLK